MHNMIHLKMSNRFSLLALLGFFLALYSTHSAEGGFVVSFGAGSGTTAGPVSFVEGQAGRLNVFIQRDAFPTEPLLSFTVRVNLSAVGGAPANGLLFASTQQQSQLVSTSYVFAGNSSVVSNNGQVGNVQLNGLRYTGSDTVVGSAVSVPTSNRILFSLDMNPVAQGTYQISVDTTLNATGFVGFLDEIPVSIPFAHSAGLLSVVPEPGSILLLFSSIPAFYLAYRRTRARFAQGTAG